MKKIGVVSCYFKHNYGSMLQAYATQMALDKLGYENETIDISGFSKDIKKSKIKYFVRASLTSDILFSKMGMAKNLLIKKFLKNSYALKSKIRSQKFNAFSSKYFRLSLKYNSISELNAKCADNYSDIIVGSDQLWLPANIAANYYTLSFVPEGVNSIAYATSFGIADLPKDSAKKAQIFLKKIKHVSVRENAGQNLVKTLTGRNVPVVCDPTLLFNGDEWMNIQKKNPIIKDKYILCYFLGKSSLSRNYAKHIKEITGYKIVALTHLDEYVKNDEYYADETPYDIDPADFLNLIRNAEYVCTDSFHCTVFSILYRKRFFTFKRYMNETKQSTNNRLDTLLNLLGITDHMIKGNEKIEDLMKLVINYDFVHEKLDIFRTESYKYLKAAINDDGSTDL